MGKQSKRYKRHKRHKPARHGQLSIRGRVGSQTTAGRVGRRGERMLPTEEGPARYNNLNQERK